MSKNWLMVFSILLILIVFVIPAVANPPPPYVFVITDTPDPICPGATLEYYIEYSSDELGKEPRNIVVNLDPNLEFISAKGAFKPADFQQLGNALWFHSLEWGFDNINPIWVFVRVKPTTPDETTLVSNGIVTYYTDHPQITQTIETTVDEDIYIQEEILIQPDSLEFTVCHENPQGNYVKTFKIKNLGPHNYEFDINGAQVPFWGNPEDPFEGHLGPYEEETISIHCSADNHGLGVLPVGDYNVNIEVFIHNSPDGGQDVLYIMPVLVHIVSCPQVPEFPFLSLPIVMLIGFALIVIYLKKYN